MMSLASDILRKLDRPEPEKKVRGVNCHHGRYEVRIYLKGKRHYLGSYLTREEAEAVAVRKRQEMNSLR